MLSLSATIRIFLCAEPADLRKSFDGLSALVRQALSPVLFLAGIAGLAVGHGQDLQDRVKKDHVPKVTTAARTGFTVRLRLTRPGASARRPLFVAAAYSLTCPAIW